MLSRCLHELIVSCMKGLFREGESSLELIASILLNLLTSGLDTIATPIRESTFHCSILPHF